MKSIKSMSKAASAVPPKKKNKNATISETKIEKTAAGELSSPNSNSENISPTLRPKRSEKKPEMQKKLSPKQKSVSRDGPRRRRNKSDLAAMVNSSTNSNITEDALELNSSIQNSLLNITKENTDESLHSVEVKQATPNSVGIANGDERKLRSGRKNMHSIFDTPTTTTLTIETSATTGRNLGDSNEKKIERTLEYGNIKKEVGDKIPKYDQKQEAIVDVKETDSDDTAIEMNVNVQDEKTKAESEFVSNEEHVIKSRHDEKDANIKSPSVVSVDSAKGSSIGPDSDCTIFTTGDLYWGRIHHFSFWACIVCPDDTDDDKPVTRLVDQQLEVHVRFFADNARHSWVKRENLMPYQGLESYQEYLRDLKDKFGAKSVKYLSFLPKRTKVNAWVEAVKEADEVANLPYTERLTKFYQLNNIARERNKEERIRRKSMSVSRSLKTKIHDDDDDVTMASKSSELTEITSKKRNRSESPASPAFSPIRKAKRRKTTTGFTELRKDKQSGCQSDEKLVELKKDSQSPITENTPNSSIEQRTSLLNNELFNSPQFNYFYETMKKFVMKGAEIEVVERNLFNLMKNTWVLKSIVEERLEQQNIRGDNEFKTIKRLSLRLKERQEQLESSPVSIPNQSAEYEKRHSNSSEKIRHRKWQNRPIAEVIDDIFSLDTRYLFDNMGRDPVCKYCYKPGGNLKRCSKSCQSWLHPECLSLEFGSGKVNVKGRHSQGGKKRLLKRQSISSTTAITAPNVAPTMVHVTADSFESDQNQVSEKIKSNPTEEDKPDTPVSGKVENAVPVVCRECTNEEKPKCFVCHLSDKKPISMSTINDEMLSEEIVACNMTHCTRFYHPSCLKYWPQAKITKSKNSIVSLRCPSHVCHTCVSDDPKGKFQHLNNAHTTKCVKCPATYHMDSTCIPAGSEILTAAHMICPRHTASKSDQHVNVSWCFICVRGGQLICCETCPTAVHAECLNVALDSNESYICDECESGRLPLYGEMVWAKFTAFRWWPAIILPPTEVPLNIRSKVHNAHEFVVRFFGTHDHGWISRRRVYLYVEGDWSEPPKTRRVIDQSYLRGVIEAKETYDIIKAKNIIRVSENENKEKLHPQPYVKIRVNRAVPPVKLHPDLEKVSKCECNPNDECPCGPETNCLNRVLYHECNPKICPAGERCQNQMFESRVSPALEIFYAKKERGFGLRCTEAISAGTFIIEYVGEVINSDEFQRRMQQKSADRDENYYFLTVEKDYIIDAGPKGNMARFMNHSCDPNCETQKWSVNGLNRVGLFAIKDIPANTELTFNYHWDELLGNDKKVCFCGCEKCTGQIGKISKDFKVKQTNFDETVSETNSIVSINEQSKSSKLVHRKNISTKATQHKRNGRSEVRGPKKPRISHKRKRVTSAAISAHATAADSNNIKSAEFNDKNNNV